MAAVVVRAVSLNDAHIFCAEEQVVDELVGVFRLMLHAHDAVRIKPLRYRLSLPNDTGEFAGSVAMLRASTALRTICDPSTLERPDGGTGSTLAGPGGRADDGGPAGRRTFSARPLDTFTEKLRTFSTPH